MIRPRESDLLLVWEHGRKAERVERALMMLAPAFPDLARPDFLAWSLGTFNRNLNKLYRSLFGSRLKGCTECPACSETLAFDLDLEQFELSDGTAYTNSYREKFGDYEVCFRPPRVAELCGAAAHPDVPTAYDYLLECCLETIQVEGQTLNLENLPPEIVTAVGERIVHHDPGAEIPLGMRCHACSHEWPVNFDASQFLWDRIARYAKRLLTETGILARAYGWSEREILQMTPIRRETYMEMINDITHG